MFRYMTDLQPIEVHKFGGTSVGDVDRIRAVVDLVHSSEGDGAAVVVVSAMAGVTDTLVQLFEDVEEGEATEAAIEGLKEAHRSVALALGLDDSEAGALFAEIDGVCDRLRENIGLYSSGGRSSAHCRDELLACGERLSTRLVAACFRSQGVEARAMDASAFLLTDGRHGDASPVPETYRGLHQALLPLIHAGTIPVVTGFCGHAKGGETTTLGRGGSDLSASIIGAALSARSVSLWSDVPGVLSADPRLVDSARPLAHLNYREAAEMSFFGAKVLHPRTMAPVADRGIPVRCRSTLQPEAPGTWIDGRAPEGDAPVKACTVVEGQRIVTIEGRGMPGVPGVAAAVFAALADHQVSVRMICQASSEVSISLVVSTQDALRAEEALGGFVRSDPAHRDFGIEGISIGEPVSVVAIVGEGMCSSVGVAARLCSALSGEGINIKAIAQGASEMSISVAVAADHGHRALQTVHREFGLDRIETGEEDRTCLDLVLLGVGQIGRRLIELVQSRRSEVTERFGVTPRFVELVDRSGFVLRPLGLTDDELTAATFLKSRGGRLDSLGNGHQAPVEEAVSSALSFRLQNPIVIDVTDRAENASALVSALRSGADVVTANKGPLAMDLASFRELTMPGNQALIRAEATVGAGLPVLDTLDILRSAGDVVSRIEGCFSGTLGFVCDRLGAGQPFSDAVMEAREIGYTEPDPAVDLSGLDVARKAIILARFAGWDHGRAEARVSGLIPDEWAGLEIGDLRQRLSSLDEPFRERVAQADARGEKLRYVACIDQSGIEVSLRAVPESHPTAGLSGTDNMVVFTTARYDTHPLVIRGPGAGAEVTAMGVYADILRIAAERGRRRGR